MTKYPINNIDLSIVIPAYREARRIGTTLDELASFIACDEYLMKKKIEVIVVAADSPDGTRRIVRSKKALFQNFVLVTPGPRIGKGRDVKAGMLQAKGNAVLFMDADRATPLYHITEFYQVLMQGNDVVIATRHLRRYRHSWLRIIISFFGNILFRIAGGVWVEDSQCGFKLFSLPAAQTCFSKLKILEWGFDMEVLAIAKANQLPIKTVPIDDWRDVVGGTFEDNILRNSASSLADLARILIRRVSGYYKVT